MSSYVTQPFKTAWNALKTFFTIPDFTPAFSETAMYLGTLATVDLNKARIEPIGHQYGLFDNSNGTLIGTYGRARDARRGANRRGFVVA